MPQTAEKSKVVKIQSYLDRESYLYVEDKKRDRNLQSALPKGLRFGPYRGTKPNQAHHPKNLWVVHRQEPGSIIKGQTTTNRTYRFSRFPKQNRNYLNMETLPVDIGEPDSFLSSYWLIDVIGLLDGSKVPNDSSHRAYYSVICTIHNWHKMEAGYLAVNNGELGLSHAVEDSSRWIISSHDRSVLRHKLDIYEMGTNDPGIFD